MSTPGQKRNRVTKGGRAGSRLSDAQPAPTPKSDAVAGAPLPASSSSTPEAAQVLSAQVDPSGPLSTGSLMCAAATPENAPATPASGNSLFESDNSGSPPSGFSSPSQGREFPRPPRGQVYPESTWPTSASFYSDDEEVDEGSIDVAASIQPPRDLETIRSGCEDETLPEGHEQPSMRKPLPAIILHCPDRHTSDLNLEEREKEQAAELTGEPSGAAKAKPRPAADLIGNCITPPSIFTDVVDSPAPTAALLAPQLKQKKSTSFDAEPTFLSEDVTSDDTAEFVRITETARSLGYTLLPSDKLDMSTWEEHRADIHRTLSEALEVAVDKIMALHVAALKGSSLEVLTQASDYPEKLPISVEEAKLARKRRKHSKDSRVNLGHKRSDKPSCPSNGVINSSLKLEDAPMSLLLSQELLNSPRSLPVPSEEPQSPWEQTSCPLLSNFSILNNTIDTAQPHRNTRRPQRPHLRDRLSAPGGRVVTWLEHGGSSASIATQATRKSIDVNGKTRSRPSHYSLYSSHSPGPKSVTEVPDPHQHHTFADTDDIKHKLRAAIMEEPYNIRNFYWDEGICQKIARSRWFEHLTLAVISVNVVWLAIDADHNNSSLTINAHPVFRIADNFFCSYFFVEWLITFGAFKIKRDGMKDVYFSADSVLCFLSVLDTWVLTVIVSIPGEGGEPLAKQPMFADAKILKVARMVRFFRLARGLRLLRCLPELMVVIRGISVAARAVSCTILLMIIIIYVFAIAMRQLTDGTTIGQEMFPSIPMTMKFLLITGTVPDLYEHTNNIWDESFVFAMFYLIFAFFLSITVMNMLVGIIVGVVQTISEVEKETLMIDYVRSTLLGIIRSLNVDKNDNGRICHGEFCQLLEHDSAINAFDQMGVDVVGLCDLADYMFEDNKEMTFCEFMELIMSLRGSNHATVKDLVDFRKFVVLELAGVQGAIGDMFYEASAAPKMQPSSRTSKVSSKAHSIDGKLSSMSTPMAEYLQKRYPKRIDDFDMFTPNEIHSTEGEDVRPSISSATISVVDKPVVSADEGATTARKRKSRVKVNSDASLLIFMPDEELSPSPPPSSVQQGQQVRPAIRPGTKVKRKIPKRPGSNDTAVLPPSSDPPPCYDNAE